MHALLTDAGGEDRVGLRDVMDATFALHHVAHAHNALTQPDHLAGHDARSRARAGRGDGGEKWPVARSGPVAYELAFSFSAAAFA